MLTALVILVVLVSPVCGAEMDDVASFLRDKTPPIVCEKFSQTDIYASPCVVEDGGNVYSLSAVKVRTDKSPNMQRALKLAALRQAFLRAAANLAKYLVPLWDYEISDGFSSVGKLVNDTAFGLVWLRRINEEGV